MNYNESLRYAFFYGLPAWTVALALAAIMLLAVEVGYGLEISRRIRRGLKDADMGCAIVLTALFAVLGLLLAFTYSAKNVDGRSRFI